jgi:hypothetical protein
MLTDTLTGPRELNNTYIYDDQLSCSEGRFANDEANCRVRRGGLFRESMSTSFNKSSDLMAAGGATQEIGTRGSEPGIPKLLSNSLAGVEWFALSGSNATSFPIGIPRIEWDTGFTTMHALGLGSNSTYLNALVAANQIPSRVWSFFWGRTWTRNTDMDGSVVLDGYDEQKVFLDNLTQPLDYYGENGCWTGMMVTVADIKVNFRDGNERSVMPQNVKVSSCIVPQLQLVWEGPPDIISEFQRVTGIEDGGTVNGFHANARAINASDVSSV